VELTDLATQSNIDRSTVFKHSSEQNVRRRHPALDAKQQVETVSGNYPYVRFAQGAVARRPLLRPHSRM